MAIDRSIKRIVAKNGQVYFYQYGKRIPYKKGISKFLKQNEAKIRELGENAIPKLTDKERTSLKRSQASKNRYYFDDGKGKRKYVDTSFVHILKRYKYPNIDFTERNLSTYTTSTGKKIFPRFSEIERQVSTELLQDPDIFKDFISKEGRFKSKDTGRITPNVESLTDIAELIGDESPYKNFKVSYFDFDGDEVNGRKTTMNFIMRFQNMIMGQVTNYLQNLGVLTRFRYKPKINLRKKTVVFDFTDINDATFTELLAEEVNKSKVDRTASGGITISNKYKGVIIEMDFS